MFFKLFLLLYTLCWRVCRPFLARQKRLNDGFARRLVPEDYGFFTPNDKCIWIQAASGGEAYLLCKLFSELEQTFLENKAPFAEPLNVLGTTWTRQGMDVLLKSGAAPACPSLAAKVGHNEYLKTSEASGVSSHKGHMGDAGDVGDRGDVGDVVRMVADFFPLDDPALMLRAIRKLRPRLIVLLETEIWPALLHAAFKEGIKVIVVNGRMTHKSFTAYSKIPSSFWRFMPISQIFAISEEDARRFSEIFPKSNVKVKANIKFDLLSLAEMNNEPSSFSASGLPELAVFGSVRKDEIPEIVQAAKNLLKLSPQCAIILVPRHLHHARLWHNSLSQAGCNAILRSSLPHKQHPTETLLDLQKELAAQGSGLVGKIIVWDKFGELRELYALGKAVFVGGSMRPLGGQNFLEVLELGVSPCLGPYIDNFTWVGDEILALTTRVADAESLAFAMHNKLANPLNRNELKAASANEITAASANEIRSAFASAIKSKQGSSHALAKAILDSM